MTGSIVLATDQGLGYLAKDFYDHGIIQKVFIKPHGSRKSHPEWYRPEDVVQTWEELLDCDSLLFFEEIWDWKIIVEARKRGIKTVLMPMYECTRNPLPYEPDAIICPSLLDLEYYPQGEYIPVPVEVEWRQRRVAKVFVHNAGNGGLGGRNGTKEVIEAMQYVKNPVKLLIRTQIPLEWNGDTRITIQHGTLPKEDLWSEGDVFIFPEKFNGLSLPLQEAFASGMLVMAGDRFPMNDWLPVGPLLEVGGYKRERIAVEFDAAWYDPKDIAWNMDYWYGQNITEYSLRGRKWAENHSWEKLKGKYEAVLSR